jgi:DNA repair exonuclease SbcCD nuclease subunit
MIENINGTVVKLLGDPHLGRAFNHGVPLHRRGDREEMQWADFTASVMDVAGTQLHVCMGDLFDKWTVPYSVIYRAAEIYRAAARANPSKRFVIIQGNHDASRDLERVSAFKLFSEIVSFEPNIWVVKGKPTRLTEGNETFLFVPWDPVLNAAEMIETHAEMFLGYGANVTVFGHWDVLEAFASDNLIPVAKLKELGVSRAITGHDHHARDMEIDGLPVKITGSMQTYSFAEDHIGKLYISLTKLQLESIKLDLRNMCVRVLLADGESLDKPIDCLQLKVQKLGERDFDDEEALNVAFEGFDFDKMFSDTMEELKVDAAFRDIAAEKFDAERAKQ